jgi:uncharacterized protein YkwD
MVWSRRLSAALAAATALAGTGVAVAATDAPATGTRSTSVSAQSQLGGQILADINRVRATHGLGTVRAAWRLSAAAASHSHDMLAHGFFAHESFGGAAFWTRIARYYPSKGFRRWGVGETLLWVSPDVDAAAAVQDWLESPEHRRILLDPSWHELGVSALHVTSAPGDFHGLETTVVTADFGIRTR